MNRRDWTGRRFNYLTILHPADTNVGGVWTCICDCGRSKDLIARKVAAGEVKTCGQCQIFRDLVGGKQKAPDKVLTGPEIRHYSALCTRIRRSGSRTVPSPQNYKELLLQPCLCCGGVSSHVTQLSGGTDWSPSNLVAICSSCRGWIGRHTPAEFLDKWQVMHTWIQSHGTPWK